MTESKVKLCLFEPYALKDNVLHDCFSFRIEVEGKYKDLLVFINNILKSTLKLPCLIIFESLVFDQKEDGLSLGLLLSICRKKHKSVLDDLGLLSIDLLSKDVFKKKDQKMGVSSWLCRELLFLGVIKEEKRVFGVVSDPLGYVYQVQVGDKIGVDKSMVLTIEDDKIITSDQKEVVRLRSSD